MLVDANTMIDRDFVHDATIDFESMLGVVNMMTNTNITLTPKRHIVVVSGPSCVGKSTYIHNRFSDVYRVKNNTRWFDTYKHERILYLYDSYPDELTVFHWLFAAEIWMHRRARKPVLVTAHTLVIETTVPPQVWVKQHTLLHFFFDTLPNVLFVTRSSREEPWRTHNKVNT